MGAPAIKVSMLIVARDWTCRMRAGTLGRGPAVGAPVQCSRGNGRRYC